MTKQEAPGDFHSGFRDEIIYNFRMKLEPSLEDRFQGCLLGLAIGDALGYPVEFLSLPEIRKRYGPDGIQDLTGNPALHSDDTQTSMAVARALVDAGQDGVENWMEALVREFLIWLRSPENDRAPGNTTIKGCQNLEAGISWNESGLVESKSCGAIMRVAPIGLYYRSDPSELRLAAWASAIATHAHPTALVCAEVTAFCVSWAVGRVDPSEYWERIKALQRDSLQSWDPVLGTSWRRAGYSRPEDYLAVGWAQLLAELEKMPLALAKDPADVCEILGGGWGSDEALACALACVLESPKDYLTAVRRGANTGGDSDSIACIAGAISGAYLGHNAIPKDWRRHIENRPTLIELSRQLYQKHAR
jgi:ADP-ribosylglycohydrolase